MNTELTLIVKDSFVQKPIRVESFAIFRVDKRFISVAQSHKYFILKSAVELEILNIWHKLAALNF